MGELFAVDMSADRRSLSPTDLAQFIRLEQCERYLRLRLHERDGNGNFMREYGVAPAAIPPILTRSGATFEATVMAAIPTAYAPFNCATDVIRSGPRTDDNARIVEAVATLVPGATRLLFQPRLAVQLGGWHVRGDLDILRLARTPAGDLHILIADIKSSTAAKVEHRLQVACYAEMLTALLDASGIPVAHLDLGILYRGPNEPEGDPEQHDPREREHQAQAAADALGAAVGFLELMPDPDAYRQDVRYLVTGEESLADRVIETPFAAIPYHLTYKCDGCLYNEFCMKWSAEHDDLSLLPHLETAEKSALSRAGIATMRQLATLKDLPAGDGRSTDLVPTPDTAALVRTVTALPRVGPRLDELIHRARRYRMWRGDDVTALSFIPSKGYGTLPYCDAAHDPNLVRVYIDAQHDYLEDRVYMLGALVVACEDGVESPTAAGASSISPTDRRTPSRKSATSSRGGQMRRSARSSRSRHPTPTAPRAPIHLIFYNSFARQSLLDGLGRHLQEIFGATPLYDFVTQLAGFDSSVATFLDREMRELKNYPMVCQSLQAVAAYLGFDWNAGTPYRRLFRERMFDWWGKLDTPDGEPAWYTKRARFNSQIPLEYAYAAWDVIAPPVPGRSDDFAAYRPVTVPILAGFHARRLEAMERIVKDFKGNDRTSKRPFVLPDLTSFEEKAPSLAHAIHEFVTIERHVVLDTWQGVRHAPPERRVLGGETLLVRYDAALPENAAYEENRRRRALRDQFRQAFLAANPGRVKASYTPDQRAATELLPDGDRVRLRIDCADIACDLAELLALCNLREGDWLTLFPRWTVDSRLPLAEQVPFTPTPKQLLYGMRCILNTIAVDRDGGGGITEAYADVELVERTGRNPRPGFVFRGREQILTDGNQYALDTDPNDINAQRYLTVAEEIIAISDDEGNARHALYDRLTGRAGLSVPWPEAAASGQAHFLAGIAALKDFEESKHCYIGGYGDAAMLLVQGPPGTGKSFATAYALFARVQGAMAAGRPFRVFVSCRTHAAIDVLIAKLADVRAELLRLREDDPVFFAAHFDDRLLALPFLRMDPKGPQPVGVVPLPAGDLASVLDEVWCVVGATPSAIYRMVRDRWGDGNLIGNGVCDCLVLDEASQMNLPEAMLAALPLSADGQVIVVGDHRQMPPIIVHDWAGEARRTFAEYRSYESVFLALRARTPAMIKFTESFRLHADMAAFLGREIYQQDGIAFFSRRTAVLPTFDHPDPFVSRVLAPEYPLIVVVHDEAASQTRNPFEAQLIAPVLEALADAETYALDPFDGLGVVVPHRAQRALLREAIPCLTITDPVSGTVAVSSVDTVERFQGGERDAIVVSTTESEREYLLTTSTFLLDPRRLTVAISRAKQKVILVASRSVFDLFSADEETFKNAQLWKNLVRRTCTVKLWEGERSGQHVIVWGNAPVRGDRITD